MPHKSFFMGPIIYSQGIYEIPVSGRGKSPFNILDSWYFASPDSLKTSKDYLLEAEKATNFYKKRGVGILNYYADPSHVINKEEFWIALKIWVNNGKSINYEELLKIAIK